MGILLRKVRKLDKSSTLVTQKIKIEFININVESYLEKFNLLKDNKKIIECNFEDSKWIFLDNNGTYKFDFNNISSNINIISALKIYIVILLLDENKAIGTVREHIVAIKDIIVSTNDLNIDYVEEFKEYLEEVYYNDPLDYRLYNIVRLGVKFLKFYDNELMSPIIDILKFYNLKRSIESRDLPNFESALWFNYILDEHYHNASKKERNRYFIVYLWWFITTVIPMRPGEFLEIRKECIRENSGKYYLIIPNIKEKSFREVRITKMLCSLIMDYKEANLKGIESDFLFNYDDFRETFYVNRNNNRILKEYYDNKIGSYRFIERLNDFYKEVIEKKYGIKTTLINNSENINGELVIEQIRPGDTRHFAICNLYLQGHNPLTIARLAGHKCMNTQLTYANHMKFFAESNVRVLTDMLKRNKVFDRNIRSSNFLNDSIRKSIINRNKKNEFHRIIDDGICIDREFPNNCVGSCKGCQYSIENNKDHYVNESKKYTDEIDKQINIMTNIINNTQLGPLVERNRNFDIEEQYNFGSASKKLQSTIYKKAISEYHIFKEGCIE